MRILFISYDTLAVGDGGARSAATVLGLADAGHSVDILAPRVELPDHDQIRILSPKKEGESCSIKSLCLKLFKQLLREQYDAVHAVDYAVLSAYWACRWRKTRLIYDAVRCFSGKVAQPPGPLWHIFPSLLQHREHRILQHAAAVISGCDLLTADLLALEPDASVRLLDGVPLQPLVPSTGQSARELLALPARPPQLVVVRILSELRADLKLTLMALRKVSEAVPGVFFVIRGASDAQAQTMAAHLDIGRCCRFLNDDEMVVYRSCLEEADAVLLMPAAELRYPHPAIYALLHSRAPLIAVQDSAHEKLLNEAEAVIVLPSARAISEGLSRILDEPLFSRPQSDGERESIRKQYTYSSFKHALRMIYRTLPEKE